jgi:histidinol-phosphatase (PHP family)
MKKERRPASCFLPPDLHIHTTYSEHAAGTMEETVQAAIAKGFREIGFADHFPYPSGFPVPAPNCVIPDEAMFEVYASEVRRLQSAYAGRITIRFGAEIDYLEGLSDQQASMRQRYAFDYVIGAVHIVQGVAIDYREEMLLDHLDELGGVEALWQKYWTSLKNLVRAGWCQLIGHFDLPKKYPSSVSKRNQIERAEEVMRQIKENDMALEVNTGGIDRASDREPYPSLPYLKLASELGVDVSLGSDAHAPNDIGRHFTEARSLLQSLGWNRVVTFCDGRKVYVDLS